MITIVLLGLSALAIIGSIVLFEISKWRLNRALKDLNEIVASTAADFDLMNRNLERILKKQEKKQEDPDDPYITNIEDLNE